MVQPVLFRQQPVEEIQPAPSGTHHVRQLVLHDRSLQRSRSRRHIQRQRTHMLLLVALLQVHLRHRRKPALQMRIEKPFVKHHVLHRVAVENRQQRVDMPRMKHRNPVQQKLVLVVASAVHLQVAPRQRRRYPRQNPYLREQVIPAESKHVRRSQFPQLLTALVRFHCHLFDFKQQRLQRRREKTVLVHPHLPAVRIIAHVRNTQLIHTLRRIQLEYPVTVGYTVPLLPLAVVQRYHSPVEPFLAAILEHRSADVEAFLLPHLNHQLARWYKLRPYHIPVEHQLQQFAHRHLARGIHLPHPRQVDERRIIRQHDMLLPLNLAEPLKHSSRRSVDMQRFFCYRTYRTGILCPQSGYSTYHDNCRQYEIPFQSTHYTVCNANPLPVFRTCIHREKPVRGQYPPR